MSQNYSKNKKHPRYLLLERVDPTYRVDIAEIAYEIGLEVTPNGNVKIGSMEGLSPDNLLEIMDRTASYMEYVSSVAAAVATVVGQVEVDLDRLEAEKRLKFREEHSFKRGTKSDAQDFVDSDEEIVALRKKLAVYEAYQTYLKRVIDFFEKVHYTAKTALGRYDNKTKMMSYEGF